MLSSFSSRIFNTKSSQDLRNPHPLIYPYSNQAYMATDVDVPGGKPITPILEEDEDAVTALPAPVPTGRKSKQQKRQAKKSAPAAKKAWRSRFTSFATRLFAPFKGFNIGRRNSSAKKPTRLQISTPSNFRHEMAGGGGLMRSSRGSFIRRNSLRKSRAPKEQPMQDKLQVTREESGWETIEG